MNDTSDADRPLWGARKIGHVVGLSEGGTWRMLRKGRVATPKKSAGDGSGTERQLLERFTSQDHRSGMIHCASQKRSRGPPPSW